jgi:uncharacterized protein involved in type VI secretion and phage assembly
VIADSELRPILDVAVAGEVLPRPLAAKVSLVLVRQALGVPAAAEIDFDDPDPEGLAALRTGADLELHIVRTEAVRLFCGRIVAVEHDYDSARGRIVRIRACDRLHELRQRCRVRTYEDTSVATIAAGIAADIRLELSVHHNPPARALVIQRGESDLALVRALGAEVGLYPVIRSQALHLLTLAGEGDEVPLRLGHELHAVRVRRSAETEVRNVSMVGWDAATLDPIRRTVRAACGGSYVAESDSEGENGRYAVDRLVESWAEAEAIAEAMIERAAAAAVTASGTCSGDPRLAPGTPVVLAGLEGDHGGRFVITEAIHRIDVATGYTTQFNTTPPPEPNRAAPIITCARVIAIDDPEDLGRCQVRLETFDGVNSGWLQTLVPGAGSGKGLVALPEVHDEVLVVLPDGDLTRGFVLGGLFGRQRLPRGVIVHRARPFVLRTADGQTLELGGDPSIARLSTRNGSLVELTDKAMRVAAATDLVIEAPGRTLTIRAHQIKLEQG